MNNKLCNTIGQKINTLLATKDKKQKELAEYLGVKDNIISYFVNGNRMPNTEQIIKIAQYFNVSTDYLLGLTTISTTDKNLKFVCEYTGLTENAIEVLHFYNKYDMQLPKTASFLLETEIGAIKDNQEQKLFNLGFVSAVDGYLNIKKPLNEVNYYISKSGEVVEDNSSWENKSIDEIISLGINFRQSNVVEKLLLDNIIEILKQVKGDIYNGNS